LTASLNVNVKVTSLVAVAAATLSEMVTTGGTVSGVVPPPPHADSKAATPIALTKNRDGSLSMEISWW
jgi:hypothetical protein